MFPYLDFAGYKLRATTITPEDLDVFATRYPGYIEQRIALRSSYINSRLRKRYGRGNVGNALPLGQQPPTLVASGTLPPTVTLVGRPVLGSLRMRLEVTTGGALGAALFRWSLDGGVSFAASGIATGAAVVLGSTGLTAVFGAGAYGTDNIYAASPPVPDAVLGWVTDLVTVDVWDRRGRNPQDPELVTAKERYELALADIKEAADSSEGLFDLPVNEDLDSSVTTGGPLGYSETSPYVAFDVEIAAATTEDSFGRGTSS